LASYSAERLLSTVQSNLDVLQSILRWNLEHGIYYFRISSDTVPFASHPVMNVNWQERFAPQLAEIGAFIAGNGMRINVHPGQYILLNSPHEDVVERSIAELAYHAEFLDLMNLDHTHQMQIHTGGVYGVKSAAIARFVETYARLSPAIRARLVIENDERQYSLSDNLVIHDATGIPLLFDTFHHSILNAGETLDVAFDQFMPTWLGHGLPMMDYSSQHSERQRGAHAVLIELDDFGQVIEALGDRDVDIMLEIKDKESSALLANEWLKSRVRQ
jgi:UV DNA damage endonuclease